jgi:hypothetical protein
VIIRSGTYTCLHNSVLLEKHKGSLDFTKPAILLHTYLLLLFGFLPFSI